MGCGGSKKKIIVDLEIRQPYAIALKKFTNRELEMLRNIYRDLAQRSQIKKITRDVFTIFFPLKGQWSESMFKKFDITKDEGIGYPEFVIGMATCMKQSYDEKISQLFQLFDQDQDNFIHKDEFLMMLYNYPKEDLKAITNDQYFKKENNIGEITSQANSFQSSFFMSRQQYAGSQHFQKYAMILNEQNENKSNKSIEEQSQHNKEGEGASPNDVDLEVPIVDGIANSINRFDRKQKKSGTIIRQGSTSLQEDITQQNKRGSTTFEQKQKSAKAIKHTNVPIRPANLNNVIKQYVDFAYFDIGKEDKWTKQDFQQYCQNKRELINIFARTFHLELWSDESIQNQFKKLNCVIEGYLLKRKKDSTFRKSYYILREGFLFKYREQRSILPAGLIILDGLLIQKTTNVDFEETHMYGIEIYHKNNFYPNKHLYFANEQERDTWMEKLTPYSKTSPYEHYKLAEIIGKGQYSTVFKGILKPGMQEDPSRNLYKEVAIKVIEQHHLSEVEKKHLYYEIQVIKFIHKHPGVITLFEVYENNTHIYITNELVKGGDLFDYIQSKEFLEEYEASHVMKELLETVDYIHKAGVIHRDLKPENILVIKEQHDEIVYIKDIRIIDFGFAAMIKNKDELVEGAVGTPNYVAPEIVKFQKYNSKVDNFSLGCILFFMIRGSLPFDSYDPDEIINNCKNGTYSMSDDHWDQVSAEAKDLIGRLLENNPEKRASIEEALKHPWITQRESLKRYIGRNAKGIFGNKQNNQQDNSQQ